MFAAHTPTAVGVPLLVGLLVATYAGLLAALGYAWRKHADWQQAQNEHLRGVKRRLRRIDRRGTYGSRNRDDILTRDMRKIVKTMPQMQSNLSIIAVELEAIESDVAKLTERVNLLWGGGRRGDDER